MEHCNLETIRVTAFALQQSSQALDGALARLLDLKGTTETERVLGIDYAAYITMQITEQRACLAKLAYLLKKQDRRASPSTIDMSH